MRLTLPPEEPGKKMVITSDGKTEPLPPDPEEPAAVHRGSDKLDGPLTDALSHEASELKERLQMLLPTGTTATRSSEGIGTAQPDEMDLAALLSFPGVEEICVLRSAVGFMALHGGSQDRGTHEIASRAAEQAGASYYAIVQPSGLRVHLTSRRHNPNHSERLRAFLQHVDVAISVHGFGRDGFHWCIDPVRGLVIEPYGPARLGTQSGPLRGMIVGGRNADLLDIARRLFQDRFVGYHVADERIRLGFDPHNPVNLPSARGVQVELPPGLRGIGDFGEQLVPSEDGIVTEVIAAFVELADRASGICAGAAVS